MIVLETKLRGNPTQFALIDEGIKTAQQGLTLYRVPEELKTIAGILTGTVGGNASK